MSDHSDDGYEMPGREEFQYDPLGHAEVHSDMIVGELVERYGHAGIGTVGVYGAADVYAEMLADNNCTMFMSLAGVMVLTGMRKVVSDLIRDGHADALMMMDVSLIHDAIETIDGKRHHGRAHPGPFSSPSHGSREHGAEHHGEETEREHDETFHDEEVDRVYSVYLPREYSALFESHLRSEVLPTLEEEGTVSIADLCRKLGRANSEVNDHEGIDEGAGVTAMAYEADVPTYCPVVQDSVLGLQAWTHSQISLFSLDAPADMAPLIDLTYDAGMAGCLLVGDGVLKNFTLQTVFITPGAYGYGVQTTMGPAVTDGLSGATLDGTRSWDKLEKDVRNTTVLNDATVVFPLLVTAAYG